MKLRILCIRMVADHTMNSFGRNLQNIARTNDIIFQICFVFSNYKLLPIGSSIPIDSENKSTKHCRIFYEIVLSVIREKDPKLHLEHETT